MTDPDAEFECLAARAGLAIPPERRQAVLASYRDLRSQIALLHDTHDPTLEPSNLFHLTPAPEHG